MPELFRGFYQTDKGPTTILVNNRKLQGVWLYWDEVGRFKSSNSHPREYFIDSKQTDHITSAIYNRIVQDTITQALPGLRDRDGWQVFVGDLVLDRKTNKVYDVVFKNYSYYLMPTSGRRKERQITKPFSFEVIGLRWSTTSETSSE